MAFILRRTDGRGGYVAERGRRLSYTPNKATARRYPTREAAEADLCPDNEVIEEVS